MKLTFDLFSASLWLIFIYEFVMIVFALDGLSISKLIITIMLWLSVILVLFNFIKNYNRLSNHISRFHFTVLWLLISCNLINILRGITNEGTPITTTFGNVNTTLALLVPFFVAFSVKPIYLLRIHSFFFKLLKTGIFVFVLFFIFSLGLLNIIQLEILKLFFLPTVFLITTINFQNRKNKLTILIASFLLFYCAFVHGNRTMMLRELTLIAGLVTIYFYKKFNSKWILRTLFILLLVPLGLFQSSINSGDSAFKKHLSSISNEEMRTDTRTFLYVEVFSDLLENNALLFGKGSSSTYYSPYFNKYGGDTDSRLNVEVGVLSILLKTGLFGLFLYLILLISVIYCAFFKSNNLFVLGIGVMLLVYTGLLFIQNAIFYSGNTIYIWFFIGVCLSKKMRNMRNLEIYSVFNPNKQNSEIRTIN